MNRRLRVRLLGQNPASIIQRIIFAYGDISLVNHLELNKF
jgi:precorrin isomerase